MKTVTKTELLERFKQERYLFKPPPVYSGAWSDWDWCNSSCPMVGLEM